MTPDDRGLFAALIKDGRPLLSFTGLSLVLSGLFALFLSATGHFLPHDIDFLGMVPQQLCGLHECRIVHFMIHDRVSFGGTLVAIGTLYMWLAEFPLRQRRAWAWWLFAVSGGLGFGSFLSYLGYGYLDTWHGVATIGLLPLFLLGLARSYSTLEPARAPRALLRCGDWGPWRSRVGVGRALLIAMATGMIVGGLTIMTVGMTHVFVPQDLEFMGVDVAELRAINPRLIPLIAHDRAGFGGGVCTCGVVLWFCLWCGTPSRSLWQAMVIAGVAGFATAIGVHPAIGYTDFVHLLPAYLGAAGFIVGAVLTYRASPTAASAALADRITVAGS